MQLSHRGEIKIGKDEGGEATDLFFSLIPKQWDGEFKISAKLEILVKGRLLDTRIAKPETVKARRMLEFAVNKTF